MSNPYSTPESDTTPPQEVAEMSRPKSPKVIGTIFLVFSILGAIGLIVGLTTMVTMPQVIEAQQEITGLGKGYMLGSSIFGLIVTVWLFFIGRNLRKYLDVGRRHFKYYFIITIVNTVLLSLYQAFVLNIQLSVLGQGLLSSGISILLLFIVYHYLNKDEVKASLT